MNRNIINTIVLSNNEIDHTFFVKKKGKELALKGFSRFEVPLTDDKNFENAIQEIAKYIKKDNLTNLVIATADVIKYTMILEGSDIGNLRSQILNNFKSTFDINLSDYYIDYEIYSYNKKKIVFVAGVLKEYLEKILLPFKKTKFRLLSLETEINAIKRAISWHYSNTILMNIHMRRFDTTFIVIKNNILFSFRELNFGYENIISFLSEKLNEDIDVIKFKLNDKRFSYEDIPLSDAIDRLTIEIQRTIDFYNNQYRDEPITKLVISGKLTTINTIEKFLSQFFIIDSEKFEIIKLIIINDNENLTEIENMSYLDEAIGAGLKKYVG